MKAGFTGHLLSYIGLLWWLSGKGSTCNAKDPGSIPGLGRSPGEEMATHSSIVAWRIPWTEEPGGLHSSWGWEESDTTEQLTLSLDFQS